MTVTNMYDSHILFEDLPCRIKGFTKKDSLEDYYIIVLNARISVEEQRCAYLHEMQHIQNKDFSKVCCADSIELEAHRK